MKFSVQKLDGTLLEQAGKLVGFNSKSHAEFWIQEHLQLFGWLDWRVGGLFKAKHNRESLEIVWSKTRKPVKWLNVNPKNPNKK